MTSSPALPLVERASARGMVVWAVGVAGYVVAVFARTSLSATGVEAAVRFGASSSVLSLFTVLQLAVYAGMQVPAGATIDRLGSRKAIAIGCTLVGAGQIAIAFAGDVPTAIAARVLVGTGDAFCFISVLRLLPAWFPGPQVGLVTQLTGLVGQLGQLLSLGPLVWVVHSRGWTTAFVLAGSVTLLVAALALLLVRDGRRHHVVEVHLPAGGPPPHRTTTFSADDVEGVLVRTWRNAGTRAGFWVHFTTPFSAYMFALLWGFPFMTRSQGLSAPLALAALSVFVLGCVGFGLLIGLVTSRHPHRRLRTVLVVVAAQVVAWAVVLAWPGTAPAWTLFVLALVLAGGPPTSLIGFDLARATNPLSSLGLATGMVNMGGFVSSLVVVLGIGVVLDVVGESTPDRFTDAGFTMALLVQVPVVLVGLVMLRRSLPAYRLLVGRARS
ncbi:nitrate/nitrite transporter [Cellulomonas fimi]|uniref:Lysosomal dipeptide transporter MFSD1 n=1 Tax=Cellulomonas fimi TaxID=1708 RepID=A0A7Y0LW74_CELFI|nr:MFS transporter [Cellulomonas fimi]NMR19085.1 MFS transporter [Cellulomonas fimi]